MQIELTSREAAVLAWAYDYGVRQVNGARRLIEAGVLVPVLRLTKNVGVFPSEVLKGYAFPVEDTCKSSHSMKSAVKKRRRGS